MEIKVGGKGNRNNVWVGEELFGWVEELEEVLVIGEMNFIEEEE